MGQEAKEGKVGDEILKGRKEAIPKKDNSFQGCDQKRCLSQHLCPRQISPPIHLGK
eukprot:c52141_g1_i1 orf=115-282(+)